MKFRMQPFTAVLASCMVVSTAWSAALADGAGTSAAASVAVWETNVGNATWLLKQPGLTFSAVRTNQIVKNTIEVDESRRFQRMIGFGGALTDSSAWVIQHDLAASQQSRLLTELFSQSPRGIGLNLLRLPMGASDMSASGNYSYDDVPPGKTDPQLRHFSIGHDSKYIIPELQAILKIDNGLQIVASPWSPPAWMKSTDSMVGGTLLPADEPAYAQYFVKFLQAYQRNGIPIAYLTVQNEPLYSPSSYPGMLFPAADAATFIARDLGPTLTHAHIATKILAYDHNWDTPTYPLSLYGNPAVAKYLAGTAWHNYAGDVSAQSAVHNAYPSKGALITEASGGSWQGSPALAFEDEMQLIIEGVQNWTQGVDLWNLALDPNNGPSNGGCTTCRGIVTIGTTGDVTRNVDYYALGQVSKFVQSGAYRIFSNQVTQHGVDDVAFLNPDGSKVLVVYNAARTAQPLQVEWGGQAFKSTIRSGSAMTFVWHGSPLPGTLHLGGIDPAPGEVGSAITLFGSGFQHGSQRPRVHIGSTWLEPIRWDDSTMTLQLPKTMPLGQEKVTVDVYGYVSNALPYTIVRVLSSQGWIASASTSDPTDVPGYAVDGDPGTRFSTGTGQSPGQWLQVDMGAKRVFNELVLDSGRSTGDYARGYRIYVSNDGQHWGMPIASGIGHGPIETIRFRRQTARYFRVVETRASGSWWSIADIRALATKPYV